MKLYKKCIRCNCLLKDKNAQEVGYCLHCYAVINSDFDDDEDDGI